MSDNYNWSGSPQYQDDWFGNTQYGMDYDEGFSMWSVHTYSDLPLDQLVAAFIAILAVQIVIGAFGIAGALQYSKCMVGVAGVMHCVKAVIYAVFFVDPLGVITMTLFAYPHFFLISEIDQGIMTKQNYPNEKRSCCCVGAGPVQEEPRVFLRHMV